MRMEALVVNNVNDPDRHEDVRNNEPCRFDEHSFVLDGDANGLHSSFISKNARVSRRATVDDVVRKHVGQVLIS